MRRRWTTLTAAAIVGAATNLALAAPAQATWQPWVNLGGEILHSGPTASREGNRAFARNAAGKLMMREQRFDGSWQDWAQLQDLPMVDSPAALVAGQPFGPIIDWFDVYYRAPDNRVKFVGLQVACHLGGCQENWSNGDAGGAVTSAPAAVELLTNRVDLFARGANNRLEHTWRDRNVSEAWVQWEDLGGTLAESPTAVSWWSGNRLDVFVQGADRHLWHKWWISDQGWSGWEDLGGVLNSAPSVIKLWETRLDVFARSTSDTLIHRWWDAGTGWSNWEDLGGRFQGSPAAVRTALGIEVFVNGSTGQLEHLRWDS